MTVVFPIKQTHYKYNKHSLFCLCREKKIFFTEFLNLEKRRWMCAERQVWGTALRFLSTRHILDEENKYVRGCQEQSRDLRAMRKEGRDIVRKNPMSRRKRDCGQKPYFCNWERSRKARVQRWPGMRPLI